MAWKPWQLDDPLMHGPEVVTIKDKLWRKFQWCRDKFPQLAPEGRTDVYDEPTSGAVQEFQFRRGMKVTGIADYATKVALGVVGPVAAQPAPAVFYSVTGTWGAWNNGFGFDVGVRLDPKRFYHQPVGYNTGAFLTPDPQHSYLEARSEGSAELLRLALPDSRPKVISGYSMGADVVSAFLNAWPVDRMGEIRAVVQFGDPSRPAGKTLLGPDPGGQGISDNRPPAWVLDRYYSFAIAGDMYPEAVGLLPTLYQILVRAEASAEFAMYLFGILINTATGGLTGIGGQLLGMGGTSIPGFGALAPILGMLTPGGFGNTGGQINLLSMVMNIPAIVQSLMAALQFMITNAHAMYGDPGHAVFGGLTGVDRAVQIVNALTIGGPTVTFFGDSATGGSPIPQA